MSRQPISQIWTDERLPPALHLTGRRIVELARDIETKLPHPERPLRKLRELREVTIRLAHWQATGAVWRATGAVPRG